MNKDEIQIILASSSPRRKELIKKLNLSYRIMIPHIDERLLDDYFFINKNNINIKEYPLKEAILKASSILSNYKLKENEILLTVDTAIVFNNKIYNKPKDKEEAFITLKEFSSSNHECISGYQLIYKDKIIKKIVISKVYFNKLTTSLINKYLNEVNVLDKAGSYAIQDDKKYHLIKKIEGSYYNIVGFPLEEIKKDIDSLINE